MLRFRIRLSSAIVALILFFLPWVDVNCNGTTLLSQSGFQASIGSGSLNPQLDEMSKNSSNAGNSKKDVEKSKESLGVAVAVLLSFFCLLGSVVCFIKVQKGNSGLDGIGGVLALAALVLIIIQLIAGFPVEDSMGSSAPDKSESGQMAAAMAAAMTVDTKFRFWFYLHVIALLGASSGILEPRLRRLLDRSSAPTEDT